MNKLHDHDQICAKDPIANDRKEGFISSEEMESDLLTGEGIREKKVKVARAIAATMKQTDTVLRDGQ